MARDAYCDNLPSGYYCAWSGAAYSFSTPGTHALKMVVDSTGAVPETNEADNVYIKTISVNP
jgi:subtilase family serine protease